MNKITNKYNFMLFETIHYIAYDDKEFFPEYYLYDIEKDQLKEITEEEYKAYKEPGLWSNQVLNKQQIERIIIDAKNRAEAHIRYCDIGDVDCDRPKEIIKCNR